MVTSRDVARIAGVSQATVSRVLTPAAKVSPATRNKVLAAMEQIGYLPHAGAQAMKTRRTNAIGVVVAELSNPFYSEVLDELTRVLGSQGFRVVMWNAGGGSQSDALNAIASFAVDGVVFTTATARSPELQVAVKGHVPLVLINRHVEGVECDRVLSENRSGGAAVADYLHSNGHTDAAIIMGDPNATTSRDRTAGFLDRMQELGHPVPQRLRFSGEFSHDIALHVTQSLLARKRRPSAIFCVNDNMAFGALDAMRALKMTAADCWVIGYDDVEMAAWPSFDLTTIRQPSREMAAEGARLIIERVRNPESPPRTIHFPWTLIERGSTSRA
ncbi:MAG: LacI family DNA-binding transcriptional regulator [Propionibacteriaceae bacterium]|nr:LacI family DNA-binding transcriptional regulator [Propionibacteriaceae bacterium]